MNTPASPRGTSQPTTASVGEEAPHCWRCRFFRITHLPATPYGCTLMGFQSRLLPCIEVLRADGSPCQGFMPKAPPGTAGVNPSSCARQR